MDHFLAHPPLTLAAVYPYLRARLEFLLPQQIDAPDSPDYGGLFSPEYGMADAKLSGHFVVTAAYCALAAECLGATAPPDAESADSRAGAPSTASTNESERG